MNEESQIPEREALSYLLFISRRTKVLFSWLFVVVFHLVFSIVCLLLVWIYQVTPPAFCNWFENLCRTLPIQKTGWLFSIMGVTVASALAVYLRIFQRISLKILSAILFHKGSS